MSFGLIVLTGVQKKVKPAKQPNGPPITTVRTRIKATLSQKFTYNIKTKSKRNSIPYHIQSPKKSKPKPIAQHITHS